jgi:hypothetical protein
MVPTTHVNGCVVPLGIGWASARDIVIVAAATTVRMVAARDCRVEAPDGHAGATIRAIRAERGEDERRTGGEGASEVVEIGGPLGRPGEEVEQRPVVPQPPSPSRHPREQVDRQPGHRRRVAETASGEYIGVSRTLANAVVEFARGRGAGAAEGDAMVTQPGVEVT